jgi:hypothetical protein
VNIQKRFVLFVQISVIYVLKNVKNIPTIEGHIMLLFVQTSPSTKGWQVESTKGCFEGVAAYNFDVPECGSKMKILL